MRPLDGLPRIILRRAKLVFFCRMPADGGWIKQHLGALQSGEPRAFGIPLVPANQRAHASKSRVHSLKAQIPRRKVILFVVQRIVRDVHLAINAGDGPIAVQRGRGIVIKPRRTALEQRSDDRNTCLARDFGKPLGRRPRNRLGQVEQPNILALAKVLGAKKLRQADDVCAQPRRFFNVPHRRREVRLRVSAHAHLHQTHNVFACIQHDSPANPPTRSSCRMQQGQPLPAGLA